MDSGIGHPDQGIGDLLIALTLARLNPNSWNSLPSIVGISKEPHRLVPEFIECMGDRFKHMNGCLHSGADREKCYFADVSVC